MAHLAPGRNRKCPCDHCREKRNAYMRWYSRNNRARMNELRRNSYHRKPWLYIKNVRNWQKLHPEVHARANAKRATTRAGRKEKE